MNRLFYTCNRVYRYVKANPYNSAICAMIGLIGLSIISSIIFSVGNEEQDEPVLLEFREGETSPSIPIGCVLIERVLICPD